MAENNKHKIIGYAQNTGKFLLKGAAKTFGIGLAGTGLMVESLSKSHAVRSIGLGATMIGASVVCPAIPAITLMGIGAKTVINGMMGMENPAGAAVKECIESGNKLTGSLMNAMGKAMKTVGKDLDSISKNAPDIDR